MYIKIKKFKEGVSKGIETNVFGKNTENIFIKIIDFRKEEKQKRSGKITRYLGVNVQFLRFVETEEGKEELIIGEVNGFSETLDLIVISKDFKMSRINVVKKLAAKIKEAYLLNDSDLEIVAEPKWRHENMNFRVSISDKKLKELPFKEDVPSYAELVSHVLSLGVPHYEYGDLNVIYFPAIAKEHDFIYEDPDIFIEEK